VCKRRHIAVLLFSLFRPSCCNDADDAEKVIIITLVGSPGTLALQFPLTANSSDKTVTVVVFVTVTGIFSSSNGISSRCCSSIAADTALLSTHGARRSNTRSHQSVRITTERGTALAVTSQFHFENPMFGSGHPKTISAIEMRR